MHPKDKLKSTPEAIEQGILRACCLREDNLYVAEYVANGHMVRTCRHCHAKHHTMKIQPGVIDLGLNRLSSIAGQGGRKHFTMGLNPGTIRGR
jgi:hypothetical protein